MGYQDQLQSIISGENIDRGAERVYRNVAHFANGPEDARLVEEDQRTKVLADIVQNRKVIEEAANRPRLMAILSSPPKDDKGGVDYGTLAGMVMGTGNTDMALKFSEEAHKQRLDEMKALHEQTQSMAQAGKQLGDSLANVRDQAGLDAALQIGQLNGWQFPPGLPQQYTPQTAPIIQRYAQVVQGQTNVLNNQAKQQQIATDRASAVASLASAEAQRARAEQDRVQTKRLQEGLPMNPPATGSGAGGMGARNEAYYRRMKIAANEAAQAAENIMRLPITADSGLFGGMKTYDGILNAPMNVLARKATEQDEQDYQTMWAGVSRNLAAIESAGLAPSGALTHSMDALKFVEGDTNFTKLRKMAEIRQIVEKGMEAHLDDPKLPEEEKQAVRDVIEQMERAIPYTQNDLTELKRSGSKTATISDVAKGSLSSGLQSQAEAVRAEFNSGKIDRETAKRRLDELKAKGWKP